MEIKQKSEIIITDENSRIEIKKDFNNQIKITTLDFPINANSYLNLLHNLEKSIKSLLNIDHSSLSPIRSLTFNGLSKNGHYNFIIDDIEIFIINKKEWDGRYYKDNWIIQNINELEKLNKFNSKQIKYLRTLSFKVKYKFDEFVNLYLIKKLNKLA